MPEPIVEIAHSEEFSASHRLHDPALSDEENRALYGLCNNPNGHGHNYELEVFVRGPVPASGMVMNLTDLMRLMREELLPRLDHKHLNHDVPFLEGIIPTAENIALAIWKELEEPIASFGEARLSRIRLRESRGNWVEVQAGPSTPTA
ncbi:MAG TPA: 6-carboxytetrahydropterin synthase [Planctomycetes bacterium]|nr:6-carboxytetrahydropterin synthase [Planctomycetota bacterium]